MSVRAFSQDIVLKPIAYNSWSQNISKAAALAVGQVKTWDTNFRIPTTLVVGVCQQIMFPLH